jgi:hypothetical protein
MEIRVLLATNNVGATELSTSVAEVAADLAQRKNLVVTIETNPAAAFGRLDELASFHLVHVVGTPTAALLDLAQLSIPLVVTPTRPLRRAAIARQRRSAANLWWLVHGRSNANRLVTDGVAAGCHVLPLPVLPYLDVRPSNWAAMRARSREMLNVSPGQAVIVGFGPASDPLCEAMRQLANTSTHNVVPLWVATRGVPASPLAGGHQALSSSVHIVAESVGRELLPAMDVLITGGTNYAARTPALDAACAGIPVISSTTDIAADFVDLVDGGSFLVNANPTTLVDAVDDALRDTPRGRSHRLHIPVVSREDVITTTERCYVRALQRPLMCTTALLKSTSR